MAEEDVQKSEYGIIINILFLPPCHLLHTARTSAQGGEKPAQTLLCSHYPDSNNPALMSGCDLKSLGRVFKANATPDAQRKLFSIFQFKEYYSYMLSIRRN